MFATAKVMHSFKEVLNLPWFIELNFLLYVILQANKKSAEELFKSYDYDDGLKQVPIIFN